MTAYTSTQTGNWNDAATWGGGGYPSSGADTATISSQHNVTIPAAVTITCGAITFAAGAAARTRITINGTLEMAGHMTLAATSALIMGAGSTLDLNGFNVVGAVPSEYTFTGTAQSRITIQSTGSRGTFTDPGNGCTPTWYYVDVSGLDEPIFGATHGSATNFSRYENCTFSDCNAITLNNIDVQANSGFRVVNCDFRTQAHATPEASSKYYPQIQCTGTFGSQERTVSGCTWHKASGVNSVVLFNSGSVSFSGNVVSNTKLYFQTTSNILSGNFCYNALDDEIFKMGYAGFATLTGNYFAIDQDGHPITVVSSFTAAGNVFDGTGASVDTNWLLCGAFNGTLTLQTNVCIGRGSLLTFTQASAPTLNLSRNTLYVDNLEQVVGTPSQHFAPLLITEQTCVLTGTVEVYDNLIVDPDSTTARDALIDLRTNDANQLDYCNYNAGWGYPVGASSPPVLYRHAGATMAGVGANDIAADPQFVSKTRTLATWDAANGGAGTIANAITELLKLNGTGGTLDADYTVAQLLTWVKAGFVPQNATLQGAGRTGDDIGAQNVVPVVASSGRPAFPGIVGWAMKRWKFVGNGSIGGRWPSVR